MDDVINVSTTSNMMYILDGGLNVYPGFGPDILQQALEEVTGDVEVTPITTSSVTSQHHHDHVEQSLDLDIR